MKHLRFIEELEINDEVTIKDEASPLNNYTGTIIELNDDSVLVLVKFTDNKKIIQEFNINEVVLVDNDLHEQLVEKEIVDDKKLETYLQKSNYYNTPLEVLFKNADIQYIDYFIDGPMFIMPNGKIVDVDSNCEDIRTNLYRIHLLLCDKVVKKWLYKYDSSLVYDVKHVETLSNAMDYWTIKYGVIRINTGELKSEKKSYCVIPSTFRVLNLKQQYALEDFIEFLYESGKTLFYAVVVDNNIDVAHYNLSILTPKSIVSSIAFYYLLHIFGRVETSI